MRYGKNPDSGQYTWHTGEQCGWRCPEHMQEAQQAVWRRQAELEAQRQTWQNQPIPRNVPDLSHNYQPRPVEYSGSDDFSLWMMLAGMGLLFLGAFSCLVGYPGIWLADYVHAHGINGSPAVGVEIAVYGSLLLFFCLIMDNDEANSKKLSVERRRKQILRGHTLSSRALFYGTTLVLAVFPCIGLLANYFIDSRWIFPWFWPDLIALVLAALMVSTAVAQSNDEYGAGRLRGVSFIWMILLAYFLSCCQSSFAVKLEDLKAHQVPQHGAKR